ncbi:MAG TPA: phosphonate ABC transporter ATP-binding protein [Chloroflexota bacterium]|jgi:phosphonate transport system ATP-binding protein|nr:phosphonate ABC transporter ATP-binding protein [Chloroflexota bacterium]
MLVIEHLVKDYAGGVRALDDVSLEVRDGEFVVLIGLSGSGKSTLLRCINRLVEPTAGRIVLDDVDITAARGDGLRRVRRRIGMIFQQFNLVKRSTVLTNVLTGRLGYVSQWQSLLAHWSEDDYRRALVNIERVGLRERTHQRADRLSGGQQQRVAIARALMQEPKIMLADEPVASLDPATSHSVLQYLQQINGEGMTVICSLHFLSLARTYGTRVIALKGGRLMFDGKPSEIDQRRFQEIYGDDAVEVEIE